MKFLIARLTLASALAGASLSCLAGKLVPDLTVPSDLFSTEGSVSLCVAEKNPDRPKPTGTVDPRAVILSFAMDSMDDANKELFWGALDKSAPDVPGFDVLRLDLRKTGRFKEAITFSLKPGEKAKNEFVIQGIVRFPINGQEIACLVDGSGTMNLADVQAGEKNARSLFLNIIVFGATQAEFNGKAYAVAVGDGNSNGRLTDITTPEILQAMYKEEEVDAWGVGIADKPPKADDADKPPKAGDVFVLDLDGNGFKGRRLQGYLGIPFCLDGQWFSLTVEPQTQELVAQALPVPGTGTLAAPAGPKISAKLVGDGRCFEIVAGQPAIPLKAGTYQIIEAAIFGPDDSEYGLYADDQDKTYTTLKIEDGQKTLFPIPSKITLELNPECEEIGPVRLVTFDLSMKSPEELNFTGFGTAKDGQDLPRPKLTVRDAAGKVVYAGNLGSEDDDGWHVPGAGRDVWRVPMALAGKFTATVEYALPVPVKNEPVKFTVPPSGKHPVMLTLPVKKVQSSMGLDPETPAICAFDERSETCLATAKPPKNGDLLTVILSKPLAAPQVTGLWLDVGDYLARREIEDGEEIMMAGSAVLEISTNGTDFQEAKPLLEEVGSQEFSFKGKAIVAFRIRFTSDWTAPFCLTEASPKLDDFEDDDPKGDPLRPIVPPMDE